MSYGGYNSRKRGRENDFEGDSSSPARSYRRYNTADAPQNNRYNSRGRGGFNQREPAPLSGAQRFKNDFWRAGEVSADGAPSTKFQDLSAPVIVRMANVIRDVYGRPDMGPQVVNEMLAVAVAELPHKLSLFAAVVALLAVAPVGVPDTDVNMSSTNGNGMDLAHPTLPTRPTFENGTGEQNYGENMTGDQEAVNGANGGTQVNVAHQLLSRLSEKLVVTVSDKDWLQARQILRFLCLCSTTHVPSVQRESAITIISELGRLLDDSDVKLGMRDLLATIVGESVTILATKEREDLEAVRQTLSGYAQDRHAAILLADRKLLYGESFSDPIAEIIDLACSLETPSLPFVDYSETITELKSAETSSETAFVLPPIIVPTTSLVPLPIAPTQARLRLFSDDTAPAEPVDSTGYWTRQIIFDMMEIYSFHRRECARLLLELGNGLWLQQSLLKPKQVENKDQTDDTEMSGSKGTWLLENTIVECLLSSLLSYPQPQKSLIYYTSLLVELCKLSPSTIAPAMGKCVRKLYANLASEETSASPKLDAEGVRRFTEWFSVHLSNFNFSWRWPEWQVDTGLPDIHPKKSVINRLLDLETRLSYFDRVKATLPETYGEAGIMSGEAPLVAFTYENEEHPHYKNAQQILSLIRGKSTSDVVLEDLLQMKQALTSDSNMTEDAAAHLTNDIAFQSVLLVGSKSFSHFLNVVERYISLLKPLTEQSGQRIQFLQSVATFFDNQEQFAYIVIDKLLRYRIVDPIDLVNWLFTTDAASTKVGQLYRFTSWDIVDCSLALTAGRVKLASERLAGLQAANAERLADADAADNTAEPDAELVGMERQAHNLERELSSVIRQLARSLYSASGDSDSAKAWWALGWATELGRKFGTNLADVEGDLKEILDDSACGKVYKAAIKQSKVL